MRTCFTVFITGTGSPFRAVVPYNFQMRAGLNTPVSIFTLSVENLLETSSRIPLMIALFSSFAGQSGSLKRRCPPLPDMAVMGSGNPSSPVNHAVTGSRRARASWSSLSDDDMPAGLTGSMSIGNHRRATTSLSDVVMSLGLMRLYARPINRGSIT